MALTPLPTLLATLLTPGAAGDTNRRFLLDALRVRYQPIIRLAGMRTDSVEVLARSEAAGGALSGPETIVEAMTGPKESLALSAAIMQHALTELSQIDTIPRALCFAVNLPLDALLHPDLLRIIETINGRGGSHARKLRFELTERHPVREIGQVAAVVAVLRQAGYALALDDITPDMPNLQALMDLPIHAIKLDRSVVVGTAAADQAFVRRIVRHAADHDQDVIAEGIETPATLASMQALGVTHGQGFLFSRPLAAAALNDFLKGRPAGRSDAGDPD